MSAAERTTMVAAAQLSRRTVLRAGGVLASGAWGSTGCAGSTPAWLLPLPSRRLASLSPRTYATLTAACARIAGPRVAAEIEGERLRPGPVADAWLTRTPTASDPLNQALMVLEFGVYPLVAKLRPFTALDGAAQDAVLRNLQASRLGLKRALFAGIHSIALLSVYLTPEAHALIGYPGPFGTATVSIGDAMAPLPDGAVSDAAITS